MDFSIGNLIDGRFEITAVADHPALFAASSWHVVDTDLVGVPQPPLVVDVYGPMQSEQIRALELNIRILFRFNHPSLERYLSFGSTEESVDGMRAPYLVRSYPPGQSLGFWLSESAGSRTFDPSTLISSIASAIEYVHALGCVHYDINPHNVIVSEDGHATLIGFYLGRAITEILGKPIGQIDIRQPLYLSPETSLEGSFHPEGDVYAFALVAGELLAGEYLLPMNPGDCRKQGKEFVRHRNLSYGQTRTLRKALAMDPSKRLSFLHEIVEGLTKKNRHR